MKRKSRGWGSLMSPVSIQECDGQRNFGKARDDPSVLLPLSLSALILSSVSSERGELTSTKWE